jgi:hypothetical protein
VLKILKIILVISLFAQLKAFGQHKLAQFKSNTAFELITDSIQTNLTLYYEKNSYAELHKALLKSKIEYHLQSTLRFAGVEHYNKPIHYFILSNKQRIKLLVGYETNGNANVKNNFITAIFSAQTNAVYSNHELFHLIAMNQWGNPETWINEGMAVYADNQWRGYDLHVLSKYLIDHGKYIELAKIAKNLKSYDAMRCLLIHLWAVS